MSEFIEAVARLVYDAATGRVIDRALEPVLAPAWEILRQVLFPRWGPAVDEIRLNLDEAIEKRRAENRDYVRRLQESLQQGEADALVTHFARAAAQATTHERMRMLAAAAAGVLTTDLDSETRSRVARAIEQLEPTDIVSLRGAIKGAASQSMILGVVGGEASRAALVQVGAMTVYSGGKGFAQVLEVTALGRAILKTLEAWKQTI